MYLNDEDMPSDDELPEGYNANQEDEDLETVEDESHNGPEPSIPEEPEQRSGLTDETDHTDQEESVLSEDDEEQDANEKRSAVTGDEPETPASMNKEIDVGSNLDETEFRTKKRDNTAEKRSDEKD